MPNLLANEKSLYLRQHAENPVAWRPWGPAAFAEARERDVPVLVSSGYSSCHWCHVMARESFSDPFIAELMNRHFVCVKVDREERPEVDKFCMDTALMIQKNGGWPLNVFFFPDGRPFFASTYLPPDERVPGLVPWPQFLMRITDFYIRARNDLAQNAEAILENLLHNNAPAASDAGNPAPALDAAALTNAARAICGMRDAEAGGFGGAPKFPQAAALDFLMQARGIAWKNDPALGALIDTAVPAALTAMANGALCDQIGGGFFRYCTDKNWRVPHFEKMLYDNAQLLELFASASLVYPEFNYKFICEETANWLIGEAGDGVDGFAAAFDADAEHVEGGTYYWTPEQVADALDDVGEARAFCETYAIAGVSIPVFAGDDAARERFREARERLRDARALRPQPACDTKIISGWNALAMRALARAGWACRRPEWVRRAARVSDFIAKNLRFGDGSLAAVFYQNEAAHAGTLCDYAWLADAELALASVVEWASPGRAGDVHVQRAIALAEQILTRFGDAGGDGFFLADKFADTGLPVRQKDWHDSATPAGNAALAHVFAALYAITGEARWREAFESLRRAYAGLAAQSPLGTAHALAAFAKEISSAPAVLKIRGDEAIWGALRVKLNTHADAVASGRLIVLRNEDAGAPPGFQLCAGGVCRASSPDLAGAISRTGF